MLISAAILVTLLPMQTSDNSLYDLVRDAMVANRALTRQGTMKFTLEHIKLQNIFREPTQLVGDVTWASDGILWVYRLSDPNRLVSGSDQRRVPIEDAVIEYRLFTPKDGRLYLYNWFTNTLMIHDTKGGTLIMSSMTYFDVLPDKNWQTFCPPSHREGRDRLDMLGPSPSWLPPGSKLGIALTGGDMVRQTRVDADGSRGETVFSMRDGGNVVQNQFMVASARSRSSASEYEWGRAVNGASTLKRCSVRYYAVGSKEVEETYNLSIASIDVSTPVRGDRVSVARLMGMLPPDVLVDDRITGKQRRLTPLVGPSETALKVLACGLSGRT